MKKLFIISLPLSLLFLLFTTILYADNDRKKKILLLHSYHVGYPWSDGIHRGILDQLKNVDNLEIYTEYMDLIKNKGENKYLKHLEDLFLNKYSDENINFDVIIAIDDNAFDFLLKRRDILFKNVPIVFCGINNFKKELIKGHKNITGVNEQKSAKETIELALSLSKKAKKLGVITGSRLAEQRNLELFQEAVSLLKVKIEIVYLSNIELNELKSQLSKFEPDDILFYLSFLQTPSGIHFDSDEIIKILSESTNAKIFVLNDHVIKYAVIGGKVTYSYAQGESAGKMALKILKGRKADNIPIMMESPNKYIFNAESLQKHNILRIALPKDSIIINLTSEELSRNWEEIIKGSFFGYDLFKNHGTIMLIIDPKTGIILDANDTAKLYYGYPKLLGKKIQEINTLTEEQVKQELQRAKDLKHNFFNFRHLLANGEIRDVEVYSYPITLKTTPLLFSIIFDVTDKLAAESKSKKKEKLILVTLSIITILSTFLILILILFIVRKNRFGKILIEKNKKLEEANAQIKTLSGIIPICMHCKKIRDDQGYWNQLEKFISEHTEAMFSHGICPTCMRENYKDFIEKDKKDI